MLLVMEILMIYAFTPINLNWKARASGTDGVGLHAERSQRVWIILFIDVERRTKTWLRSFIYVQWMCVVGAIIALIAFEEWLQTTDV